MPSSAVRREQNRINQQKLRGRQNEKRSALEKKVDVLTKNTDAQAQENKTLVSAIQQAQAENTFLRTGSVNTLMQAPVTSPFTHFLPVPSRRHS